MEIIILGSCVTRDAFNNDIVVNLNTFISVRRLFARTSFISLNSPPLDIDVSEITNISPFESRYVLDDVNKEFFNYIKSRNCSDNYLVLDFIDERMDVMQINQHFITLSEEFLRSGLSARFNGARFPRLEFSTTSLWKSSCLSFIETIKNIFPPQRVILHRAFWNESYRNGESVEHFPARDQIANYNNLLEEYYHFFETSFPDIGIVDLSQKGYISDKNHKWGLQPFHYEMDYYTDFLRSLENIFNKSEYFSKNG
jgi:hypothetical protein